jgi:hypothetical protein
MGSGGPTWTEDSYKWDSAPSVSKKSARSYADEDKRKYTPVSEKGIAPPIGLEMIVQTPASAILVVDVTGSMKDWPPLIFEKIPTLYNEANVAMQGIDLKTLQKGRKVEDLLEMAVIAVGDAKNDSYPLQVVNFSKGQDLVDGVNKILPEGRGGPFGAESYELVAHYLLNHCTTSKKIKPVCIFAVDEQFYKHVEPKEVKDLIGDDLSQSLDSAKVIKELSKKLDIYVLRPEPQGPCEVYERAQKQWTDILGDQRVLKMDDPKRLVDCCIGIVAYAANNYDLGKELLERRQTPDQVKEVLRTLHPLTGK